MTYNTFGPERHFLMAQPSVVIVPTSVLNVAMPLMGLAFDHRLQQLVCAVLVLYLIFHRCRVIVRMLAFLLGIQCFVGRLCLLDVSQSSGESSL